jgi:putative selenate reductase
MRSLHMSDRMRIIPFQHLLRWICAEYRMEKSIFGLPAGKFYLEEGHKNKVPLENQPVLPLGPAAGPHTQLAQNLVAAYLTGGRYFELKTVQILDRLSFPKPCINAEDECYNTEWSTELSIEEALAEYIKGWILLHFLARELFSLDQPAVIFNMSVGYDLEGIKSAKVDHFTESLKDASATSIFRESIDLLRDERGRFRKVDENYINSISPKICSSISLSTMHGCPPAEIEAICEHLMTEKQLDTHVKLNPTLLGFQFVRDTIDKMGYEYVTLSEDTFTADLSFQEAVPLVERLTALGVKSGREFGVKLSNTLPVKIARGELEGEEMYLSGKPLYSLTINLANKLAEQFGGKLNISYSGGADRFNIANIIETGIQPVTVVSTLLKPNGYHRLKQLAEIIDTEKLPEPGIINVTKLNKIASEVATDSTYRKNPKKDRGARETQGLPLFDCRAACTICSDVCPNRANIRVKVFNAEESGLKYEKQILHIDGMCNECGNCATFCPYGGKPYRDKPTLYWFEDDFANSENEGFLIKESKGDATIKIRFNGEVSELSLDLLKEKRTISNNPAAFSMIMTILEYYQYLII